MVGVVARRWGWWAFSPTATPTPISLRCGVSDTRRAAAWNWVGLRAPHLRSLFYEKSDQKRATRLLWSNPSFGPNLPYGQFRASALRERYALSSRLGSLRSPFLYCPFSGRRAQSPAVAVAGQFTSTWLLYGAPFMPPRKRAQGFDVALYRRGAGRLVAAEVGFAASRTSSWQTPTAKRTNTLPTV